MPINKLTPQEIKRANMDRKTCIVCGRETKQGLSDMYCPNDCDLKDPEDTLKLETIDLDIDWDLQIDK